jgi:hypothetical protein
VPFDPPSAADVRAAIEAAGEIGRWDVAQEIAESSNYPACLGCHAALATHIARGYILYNFTSPVQLCDGCNPGREDT